MTEEKTEWVMLAFPGNGPAKGNFWLFGVVVVTTLPLLFCFDEAEVPPYLLSTSFAFALLFYVSFEASSSLRQPRLQRMCMFVRIHCQTEERKRKFFLAGEDNLLTPKALLTGSLDYLLSALLARLLTSRFALQRSVPRHGAHCFR